MTPLIKSKLPSREDNYDVAWKTFTDYYENSHRLVDHHLSEFLAVKPMEAETAAELNIVMKKTFNPLAALTSLGLPVDKWDALLVFYTVDKFKSSTRKNCEIHLGNSTQTPTWKKLKEFSGSNSPRQQINPI